MNVEYNAKAPSMRRKLQALASLLVIATSGISARSTLFHSGPSSEVGRDEFPYDEDEYVTSGCSTEVDVENGNFDKMPDSWSVADLTNDKSGDSSSEQTYCNTWCMLKQSLGLTIVGFLFVCIR